MMCLAGCGKAFHFGAVVSILDSHRRDPGSIPCNVTFCPNLEIVTHRDAKHADRLGGFCDRLLTEHGRCTQRRKSMNEVEIKELSVEITFDQIFSVMNVVIAMEVVFIQNRILAAHARLSLSIRSSLPSHTL
jgi:hypothetical protein